MDKDAKRVIAAWVHERFGFFPAGSDESFIAALASAGLAIYDTSTHVAAPRPLTEAEQKAKLYADCERRVRASGVFKLAAAENPDA